MKNIVVLALHLGTGGIENAISSLSNILCEKYNVKIISTYKVQEKPAFTLDKRKGDFNTASFLYLGKAPFSLARSADCLKASLIILFPIL